VSDRSLRPKAEARVSAVGGGDCREVRSEYEKHATAVIGASGPCASLMGASEWVAAALVVPTAITRTAS